MSVSLSILGGVATQFFDNNGVILSGGKIYTYAAGTTTPQATYTSVTGVTPHTNPIVLDSAGRVPGGEIWLTDGLAYKFVIETSSSILIGSYDNISSVDAASSAALAAPGGSALIGFLQAGAGAVARTAQAKMRECISLADFAGFDNTGATSINACLALAKAYCDTFTVTPDANGPRVRAQLYIPPGTYLLTADAALPLEVECEGQFIGAFKLTQTNVKRAYVKGLSCTTLELSGVWFSTYEDILSNNILINGGGVGFGTFWNSFNRIIGDITIDLTNWSVNQNTFNGRGSFITTGTGGDSLDGHANNTAEWDFTPGTCLNDSGLQQTSLLTSAYYEAGADITGPYHVIGFQGDAEGPPKVGRRNHIFAAYDVIEKNRADFLATGGCVLAGGNWDDLDSAGKPPCLTGPAGSTVTTNTTEPFRVGKMYGGTFTAPFSNFQITIPPCPSGRFSMNIAYNGDDFAAVEVSPGGAPTTNRAPEKVVIDSVNNWKLMRISGNASATMNTVVSLFVFTAVGGSKTINIGGMYCSQEKAAQLPSPSYIRTARGSVTQGYVATPPWVDIVVTFPKAFSAVPQVTTSVVSTGAPSANFSKVLISSLSTTGFTARVFYATDFQCELNWIAEGLN